MNRRALVPVATAACPTCGGAVRRRTAEEPALLRHGGHGATRRTVVDYCPADDCGWTLVREVTEVRP